MCSEQFMEIIKKWLGIEKLEKEVEELKEITTPENSASYEKKILKLTQKPTSTTEIAKRLKLSRSRTSNILNKLEKQNKVFEHSKKGREVLYKIK